MRKAKDRDARLEDLSLDEFQQEHSGFDDRVYEVLGVEQAVDAFVSYGSTGRSEVERQIAFWHQRLELGEGAPEKTTGAATVVDAQSPDSF